MAVSGTFTTTGTSAEIALTEGMMILDFGTGTVALEVQTSAGGWVAVEDASGNTSYTADIVKRVDGAGATYRLNCTVQSGDIVYNLFEINTPQA